MELHAVSVDGSCGSHAGANELVIKGMGVGFENPSAALETTILTLQSRTSIADY